MNPDTVLRLEAALAISLLCGAVLARVRQFRLHGLLQSLIVAANLVAIATAMIPPLRRQLAAGPLDRTVLVHALIGTTAESLAVYVAISAALGRLKNYKPWMRLTLLAWLAAFGMGIATYRTLNGAAPPKLPTPAQITRITVKNFEFEPAEIAIVPGAEIEWLDEGGRHSVRADNGSFQSDVMTARGTYRHRFDQPGTYRYYCEFHGSAGGHDMAGTIVVAP